MYRYSDGAEYRLKLSSLTFVQVVRIFEFSLPSLSTHQEEEEERRRRNVQRHAHDGEKQREISSGTARTRAFCF